MLSSEVVMHMSVRGVCGAAAVVGLLWPATVVAAPTFNKDVAPIIYSKCAQCHRPGEVAGMSLMTYKDARPWARAMRSKTTKREMPPWSADPRFGTFANDMSLSQAQIDTIAAWVEAGAPEGEGVAPEPPTFNNEGWRMVNGRGPDAILEMPMEFQIPAEGQVPNFLMWDKNPFD
jgi:mono/diheme cytochrome c family protein